jgi:hypothetical protein
VDRGSVYRRPGGRPLTRIDRLARSIGNLQDIVRAIRAKGAALKATEQPIDTGTAGRTCSDFPAYARFDRSSQRPLRRSAAAFIAGALCTADRRSGLRGGGPLDPPSIGGGAGQRAR